MIVVDTNILSELCRDFPDRAVVRWYALQQESKLFTTTVSRGEMLYGALTMAPGKKRELLMTQIDGLIHVTFDYRQLSFDSDAADEYARLKARCKRVGRPPSEPDAMIAAIASAHGYAVATRNVKDFEAFGIELINPFDASGDLCIRDAEIRYSTLEKKHRLRLKEDASISTFQYRTN
jgi:toxin FitB